MLCGSVMEQCDLEYINWDQKIIVHKSVPIGTT